LFYTVKGKLYKDKPENKEEIITTKDGPLWVKGAPDFEDPDGNKPESKEHFSLCRCGGSKNKPFCDGTHFHIKFKAD
jgi:CDGSH-type Zn-finger protein